MREVATRLLRMTEVRVGLAIMLTFAIVAIYAPFIVGEVAIAWRGDDGWSLPILADLFNKRSYSKPHDLLFNIIALALPALIVLWLALRRWSAMRRLLLCFGLILAAWAGCWIPLIPTGNGMQAVWTERPFAAETSVDHRERGSAAPAAIFPIVPHRFDSTYIGVVLKSPSAINPATGAHFWLGTDTNGKDVLAQMVFGARISLTVGIFATTLSMLIGILIGAASGYFGGWVDIVLQRIVEVMLCFPTFILILVVVAMLERNIFIIMTVIGLTGWAGTARLVRGEFLAQSVRDYVLAAEALGLPRWRIMFRHILPNALTPLIISATFGIAGAVASESGLAFVGLGDVNSASWGILMDEGRKNIAYGWLIWAPGIAVFAMITALNLIGNGLREALDPKGQR
ncbi:MAG: ABC transporter permease [Planctomycetes bacterium]|nr:ABC transporter permease [Planctomycetota bacterium]